ncbi:hypothetical protein, partial [Pandoraea sputorum]
SSESRAIYTRRFDMTKRHVVYYDYRGVTSGGYFLREEDERDFGGTSLLSSATKYPTKRAANSAIKRLTDKSTSNLRAESLHVLSLDI